MTNPEQMTKISRKGICLNTGRTHFKKGQKPWNKKYPDSWTCSWCGKVFENRTGHLRKYCSSGCSNRSHGWMWRGKNNPKWHGNIAEDNPNWNGGKFRAQKSGYTFTRVDVGKYRQEHRVVMENALGRKLKRGEFIHHIDGDKNNNSIENLMVVAQGEHFKLHMDQGDIKTDYWKGKQMPKETREKMSASAKKRWNKNQSYL